MLLKETKWKEILTKNTPYSVHEMVPRSRVSRGPPHSHRLLSLTFLLAISVLFSLKGYPDYKRNLILGVIICIMTSKLIIKQNAPLYFKSKCLWLLTWSMNNLNLKLQFAFLKICKILSMFHASESWIQTN